MVFSCSAFYSIIFPMQKKACGFSSATKGKFFSALQNERRQEEMEKIVKSSSPLKRKSFFISQLHSFHVLYAAICTNILHTDKRLIMSTACL
jgi:hypothetical protein